MKKFALGLALLFAQIPAYATTLPVEFQFCSNQRSSVCALVYTQTPALELPVVSTDEINRRILQMISRYGRSLAMNIEGRIVTVNRLSGLKHQQLVVDSLTAADENAPRPRGL